MIANAQTVLALLPPAVRNRVEALVSETRRLLGDHLVAIIVYGSSVRGGLTPRSDVDLLIVLRDDGPDLLRLLHEPLALGRVSARIDCRILRADEIPKAADVFPVLYDDVRGCHAVLLGDNPFADLVIHDEHRRLRVEQELRDARIRLRRLVVDSAFDDEALHDGLVRMLKAVRAPLASLLHLHKHEDGPARKDDLITVLDVLGQRYKLDTQALTTPGAASSAATTRTATQNLQAVESARQSSRFGSGNGSTRLAAPSAWGSRSRTAC